MESAENPMPAPADLRGRALVVVERGLPTAEELAVLAVVLAAVAAGRAAAGAAARAGRAGTWLRPVGADYLPPGSWRTAA
ncbi:acyl-CoA carboxylase epsilon subunit [Kitasatospora sp. NPDC088346]|uniref:acyl-CoA carboxylase epsilon subunit n=1 Tax=Kitasatospora sp. NPDC088346 TaxID=3364073 RepID=UPI0038026EAC